MKRFVLGMGLLGLMVPSIASAALSVQVPSMSVAPGSGRHALDLIFNETGTQDNENLTVYDLGAKLVPTGGASGAGFIVYDATNKGDLTTSPNYVFPATSVTVIESDASHVLADFDNSGPSPINVTSGMSAGRVTFDVGSAGPGVYHLVLDDLNSVFADADANAIPVDLSGVGTITITPEPGALSLLGVAGLLALRRRRTA